MKRAKKLFEVFCLKEIALEFQMIRAKVLYHVSVLLKLCKKKHSKDKCPSVQREWEEFIKDKGNWKGCLEILQVVHRIIVFEYCSVIVSAFINNKQLLLMSVRYWNVQLIYRKHVTVCFFTHASSTLFTRMSRLLGHWQQQSVALNSIY